MCIRDSFISIPLGILAAVKRGGWFDTVTSVIVFMLYSMPSFWVATLLIMMFSSVRTLNWFPSVGLLSLGWEELSGLQLLADLGWHLVLPIAASVYGGFAALSRYVRTSMLEVIRQDYIRTARAKGLSERRVMYGHVFRNAMLIVIAGFPSAFIGILFTGSLLIEVIFSLDGLGLLGFEAALNRDFPILFATLYFFSLLGLLLNLAGDLMYVVVDPRIDFESREV